MATLQISLTDGEQTHELTEDLMTIGRLPDNTIQIDDASVSSHHAQISLKDGQYELEDLDSTNGTRINGNRQSRATLTDKMRLRFGQVEAIFSSGEGGEILPPPEAEEIDVKVGEQSARPADFVNSSPFGRRSGKKDGAGKAFLAVAMVAILLSVVVIYLAFSLKAPGI